MGSTGKTGSQPAIKAVTGSSPSVKAAEPASRSKPGIPAVKPGSSRSVPAVRPAPAPQPEPEMELDDAEPRKSLLPPSPAAAKGYATGGNSGIVAPEQIISDARQFFGELSRSDKITVGCASLVILSCFLPWKETAKDGDVLGLMSTGVGALLGAALVIGAIFVRKRGTLPKLGPSAPWMIQLGVSFFAILYVIVFIKSSIDPTQPPPNTATSMEWTSSPSLGAFLGLLGTLGSLVGSVLGLRERE